MGNRLATGIVLLIAGFGMRPPRTARADNGAGLDGVIRQRCSAIEQKVIEWREDIHQHPELADQETRTSRLVADHLRNLGLEVRTGIARTGVVALRADMDALPVKAPEGLPFASKAKQKYLGKEVDVMHACGHDCHTAMLMGVAEVLTGIKDELPKRAADADGNVAECPLAGASEDFSFYAQAVPGLYVFLGVTPKGQDPAKAAPNHSPNFFVDEHALVVGVRTMGTLAVDFLGSPAATTEPAQSPRSFVQDPQ
jgi:metal-dependent amidase/aminoacylase/carboxypeptidase family protein